MGTMKYCVILMLFFTELSGCSMFSSGEAGGASSEKKGMFDKLYDEANAAHKDIDAVGGEWTDVDELLQESQAAAKANDFETAIKLVKRAKDRSVMAKQQFMEQQKAGPHLF